MVQHQGLDFCSYKQKGKRVNMGYIDIHSHILPGLDDGSQSMEQTMEMLHIAEAEGITHIIATPHYKAGRFRADSEEINRLIEEVQKNAVLDGLKIRIYPGTEIYYRSELENRLDSGDIHTLNHTAHVLVEFSPFEDYAYIRNAAEEIFGIGYVPVIAHVERYQCLLKDIKKVQELKNMGCGIQVNASSITGDFGLTAKRFTGKLLNLELIDYIGTDAHDIGKRKPAMQKCAERLFKKCSEAYAKKLLYKNAYHDFLNNK